MDRLASLLIIAILLSCELKDTAGNFFESNCCKIICSTGTDCDDTSFPEACRLIKNCYSCCYLLPEQFVFEDQPVTKNIFLSVSDKDISYHIEDCFHPPETANVFTYTIL